jgi:hypothetical protein
VGRGQDKGAGSKRKDALTEAVRRCQALGLKARQSAGCTPIMTRVSR